jgi:hypothetical protein
MGLGSYRHSTERPERSERGNFPNKNRELVGTPGRNGLERMPRFDGPAYDPALDDDRLRRQLGRVWTLMRDGEWRSLYEIAAATGDPETSTSAQLRHLRKPRFGGYTVEKRRRTPGAGTFEYRLLLGASGAQGDDRQPAGGVVVGNGEKALTAKQVRATAKKSARRLYVKSISELSEEQRLLVKAFAIVNRRPRKGAPLERMIRIDFYDERTCARIFELQPLIPELQQRLRNAGIIL